MGCNATAWIGTQKRCLLCWGQSGVSENTPCPRAEQHRKSLERTVQDALYEAEKVKATDIDFRGNGGGYTWTLLRLWLFADGEWHPTDITLTSDTDMPELYAVKRALYDAGFCK